MKYLRSATGLGCPLKETSPSAENNPLELFLGENVRVHENRPCDGSLTKAFVRKKRMKDDDFSFSRGNNMGPHTNHGRVYARGGIHVTRLMNTVLSF
ncbi:Hypothetical protein NTJ_13071 [Nesidiocoris tenuis]|uniref:Uncharacterized protein n=1 Tax=Nesidiocoris tenuis TaxID=355587 RepID=A0ABN7B789_9HEMI|nr:Hypothetical protein NTJ_13071 [Nesidiocoris tenuis]